MPDYLRRAGRTAFQIGSITILIQLYNAFAVEQLNTTQVQALTAFGTLFVSFFQNFLEEQQVIPAMFKGPVLPDKDAEQQEQILELARQLGNLKRDRGLNNE